jgi:hypothetical protein
MKFPNPRLLTASLLFAASAALAHPVPDVLVRSHFSSTGEAEIRVEVDPRSFEAHPEEHDYLEKSAAETVDQTALETMGKTADRFLAGRVKFLLEPIGEVNPEFEWAFAKLGDEALENPDDPAVLVGSWKTTLPKGLSGFRIESLKLTDPAADLAVEGMPVAAAHRACSATRTSQRTAAVMASVAGCGGWSKQCGKAERAWACEVQARVLPRVCRCSRRSKR